MMQRLHGTSFDWSRWRGGTLTDLGVHTRSVDIAAKRRIIRKYAVGYENAAGVLCRPKPGCVAVLFCKDELEFWTHLTAREFTDCFPEIVPCA